jgi:hypothetical protein
MPRFCDARWRLVCVTLTFSGWARALDPFEIQVYDGTANPPNVPGLEMHVNHFFGGEGAPPELPLAGQTHATLEPSYGVLPWWEIGGYFQTALLGSGEFDYAGVKLRSKFVLPGTGAVRLGANVEFSIVPREFAADRLGGELRPIVAWENRHWLLAINPILDFAFAGEGWGSGPSLEPAAKISYHLADVVGFGVEYYADFGPIASPASLSEQDHYLFEVVDWLSVANLELSLGIGEGLTQASAAVIVNANVGYTFEKSSKGSASGARAVGSAIPDF